LPYAGSPLHPSVLQSHDTLFSSVTTPSYQWYLNDSVITGANSSFYVLASAGNYSVEVIPDSGCTFKSQPYVFTPVFVYFPEFELEIRLSPNPCKDFVSVSANGKKTVPLEVMLTDALGKKIRSWDYPLPGNRWQETYSLSDLPAGIYIMQFKTTTSQKSFRLVKMK
jgi:hypothetical protein